jgi:hypothetical protein
VLIDLESRRTRFVNSGLDEFASSLRAFVIGWPQLAASDDAAIGSLVAALHSELVAIDAAAMSDKDAFWPTAIGLHGGSS